MRGTVAGVSGFGKPVAWGNALTLAPARRIAFLTMPIWRLLFVFAALLASAGFANAQGPLLQPDRSLLLNEGWGPGEVRAPIDVFRDATGRLFVTDRDKRDVLVFDSNFVWQHNLSSWIGGERFGRPIRTVVATNGTIYVADEEERRVWVIENEALRERFGGKADRPGRFGRLSDLAIDADGFLYVADGDRGHVQVFTPGALLERVFSGFGDVRFEEPVRVAVDASRRIYVFDKGSERVLVGDAGGGLLWTLEKDSAFQRRQRDPRHRGRRVRNGASVGKGPGSASSATTRPDSD